MARTTMVDIITKVRRLIGDDSGVKFDDNAVQSDLDEARKFLIEVPIEFIPTMSAGAIVYRIGKINGFGGTFEVAPNATPSALYAGTVSDATGVTVTDWTLDDQGNIIFTSDQGGEPRFYTGYVYDLYAAAVTLLRSWQAEQMQYFGFQADDQLFKPEQVFKNMDSLANDYERRCLPGFSEFVRGDLQ